MSNTKLKAPFYRADGYPPTAAVCHAPPDPQPGTSQAWYTSRPHKRRLSSLQAVEGQEGHLLPEDHGAAAGTDWRKRTIRSRWSKGQGSWSGSSRKTKAESTATNGLVESGGGEVAQTMELGTQPVEGSVRASQENVAVDMGPAGGLEKDSAAEVELKPNVSTGSGVKTR